ncbi:hypothetical protein LEP1GSC021_3418 [Leptospira noguchii str. 1993005606]|nr:hypothetical protein LEP1GSC021_3418 [Leptospira noguchii str. 1993005606]
MIAEQRFYEQVKIVGVPIFRKFFLIFSTNSCYIRFYVLITE